MAAGDSSLNGLIYKTTNGGNNWISQRDHIGTYINDIIYLDSNIAYAATNHSVYKTTNGGANWVLFLITSACIFSVCQFYRL
ncbi:MAG: hypothetical protein IPL16_12645 [Ignavibacteria bacterium]|nr:hypothetical protein [Ignavibacteria bacterium]